MSMIRRPVFAGICRPPSGHTAVTSTSTPNTKQVFGPQSAPEVIELTVSVWPNGPGLGRPGVHALWFCGTEIDFLASWPPGFLCWNPSRTKLVKPEDASICLG